MKNARRVKEEPLIISLLPAIIITLLSVFLLLNWSSPVYLSPEVAQAPGWFFFGIMVFGFVVLVLIIVLVLYYIRHSD